MSEELLTIKPYLAHTAKEMGAAFAAVCKAMGMIVIASAAAVGCVMLADAVSSGVMVGVVTIVAIVILFIAHISIIACVFKGINAATALLAIPIAVLYALLVIAKDKIVRNGHTATFRAIKWSEPPKIDNEATNDTDSR